MAIYKVICMNEAYHSGVKGQKWGVRRYQNEDGTRTALGKERERKKSDSNHDKKSIDKKKVAIGVTSAAALVAIGYSVYKNKDKIKNISMKDVSSFVDKGKNKIAEMAKTAGDKAKDKAKDTAKKTAKGLKSRADRALNAAVDAAIASAAGIATNKLIDRINKSTVENPNDSEEVKNGKKIVRDTLTASIKTGLSTNGGNNSNGNNGSLGAELSSKINAKVGEPLRGHANWNGDANDRYGKLHNRFQQEPETKEQIRNMRKAGYSIDQIEKYFNS